MELKTIPELIREDLEYYALCTLIEGLDPKPVKKEGWVVAFSDKYGTRIEKNDEDTRFKSDLEALEFVIQQARNGSQHHIDALAECGYWWEK